jgi:hypothetical protein
MQVDLGDGKKVTRFAAIIPLIFVNTGARDGTITDIMLKVKSDKHNWIFQPFIFTKFDLSIKSILGSEELTKDPSNTPFHPIHLQAKEKMYKPIAFTPLFDLKRLPQCPPGDEPLPHGIYRFEIQALETGTDEFKPKLTFNIELGRESIHTLEIGSFLIPFRQDITKRRQKQKMWYS